MAFVRACGPLRVAGLVALLFASPLINAFSDMWLSAWASHARSSSSSSSSSASSSISSLATSLYAPWLADAVTAGDYLRVYASFALSSVLVLLAVSTAAVQVGLDGSQARVWSK